jgi:NodT family efflux transporter outer membrane factor (OMF) lipoprotein
MTDRIRRLSLPLMLSTLALAACAAGPNYTAPRIASPPSYTEAAATEPTVITPTPADLSAWWTSLNDPVLNDLIHRALADNPGLQTAASRVREARQQLRIAAAAALPTLNASGNALTFNSNRTSAGTATSGGAGTTAAAAGGLAGIPIPSHANLYSVGFDATWELDLFGGTRRAVEAAKDQVQAAEWARRDGQVTLLAEIANDYLNLRALQVRIAIGQAELKRQQDLFGLIHARRQAGFVTNLDVNQQSVQVATAAAQIPQLGAQARAQIHALGVLVGQPPETLTDTLKPTNAALPPIPPSLPVGLPSDLLRRRPDIREAERRLAAANAEIGVQEANLYPKVNLLGLGSFAGTSVDTLIAHKNLQSIGDGMVTLPIFNGGRTRAAIAAAREEKTQALLAYEKVVLGGFRDVEDALARYRAEESRRTSLAQSADAARNTLVIAQDQYRTGLVTFINVLQAENAELNSRDELTQSDAQALSDLVSLYKALGGGYS